METPYLKVAKSLSPEIAYPSFETFIENLNNQEMEWYATFRNHITGKIEDHDFEELIEEGVRTILPVKTLAAMEILKDAYGWSNETLINECKKDVRVRHALGLAQLSEIPSIDALEKFNTLNDDFLKHTGIDLMAELIQKLTEEQGPVKRLGSKKIMLWAMRVA